MQSLHESQINQVIVGLLALAGMWATARSARLVGRGLRRARALDIVRGIRMAVLSLAAGFFAVGLLSGHTGFVIVGALILGEELYETGLLAVVIRLGQRSDGAEARGAGGGPGQDPRRAEQAGSLIFEVDDLERVTARLTEAKVEIAQRSRIAPNVRADFSSVWIHPRAMKGVFTQLSQVLVADHPWPPAGERWRRRR